MFALVRLLIFGIVLTGVCACGTSNSKSDPQTGSTTNVDNGGDNTPTDGGDGSPPQSPGTGTDGGTDGGNDAPPQSPGSGTDGGTDGGTGTDPSPPATPSGSPQTVSIALQRIYPELLLTHPVALLQAPGDVDHWYVVQQEGQVRVFSTVDSPVAAQTFVDISDRVLSGGEAGLLGMAFDPDYLQNGTVYLSYTARDANGKAFSHISSFQRSADDPLSLQADSEKVILNVEQYYTNHNGGNIAFGLDGYLYIGLGDGGGTGDPEGNGQNTNTLLGAMLRIDASADDYTIPPDNPFAAGGGRGEIYAWGLRNPWRWSFDRATGDLWAGDVGQGAREEIDIIRKGGNYGWSIREGSQCLNGGSCDGTGLINPVMDYGRDVGKTVTGGYVYRGTAIPDLQGVYVYGDFSNGKVWALWYNGSGYTSRLLVNSGLGVASFGEDNNGELYVLDYFYGAIYRIEPASATSANN